MERCPIILLFGTMIQTAACYPFFEPRLPNGNFVPHPCKPNYIWKGVGHENEFGGGARNPFGRDFADNGFKWDQCICRQDSDGDGRTNGEELGDPECTWTSGKPPKHKFGLSHPGVCEPIDSEECMDRNEFEIDCSAEETTECEALSSPDVKNITIRFPSTSVPPRETTYICMTFDIPDDADYHMIAYEPLIDNRNVMHHIVVTGCRNDSASPFGGIPTPTECGMAEDNCQDIIALWGVGAKRNCLPDEFGFRIGINGYKSVLVQMHWTNPLERTDYFDGSGMVLFYTPVLRDNDAQILRTGQYYLQIPPGKSVVHQDGFCSSHCSSSLPQSVYISLVNFHMHYLGHSGYTELWRDGAKVTDLIRRDDYDYDRPETTKLNPHVELKPGDVLKTRCTFNSLNRNKITFFGDGSYDEMCITFFTIYPSVGLNLCGEFGERDFCVANETISEALQSPISSQRNTTLPEPCVEFLESQDFRLKTMSLISSCDRNGAECKPGCKPAIEAFQATSCFQGPDSVLVETLLAKQDERPELKDLRYYLHSCDQDGIADNETDNDDDRPEACQGGSDRYDQEINGLPVGGVCPFSETSAASLLRPVKMYLLVAGLLFLQLGIST